MSKTRLIIYGFFSLLLLTVGSGYLYLFGLGGLESQVNKQLINAIGSDSPIQVEIGGIHGDLLSDAVLRDITVSAKANDSVIQLLTIDSLKATYQLSDLIRGEYIFSEIEILGPEIIMTKDEAGHWNIPGILKSKNDSSKAIEIPSISVEAFMLTGGKLLLLERGDTTVIEGASLIASLEANSEVQSIDIRQISFGSKDRLYVVQSSSAKVTIQNDNIIIQNGSFIHEDTRLKFDGQIELKNSHSWLNLNIDNLDMSEISRLTGAKLSGNIDLTGRVEQAGDAISGNITLGGQFINIDLENLSLDFEFADKILDLPLIYGSILGGCAIDGSGLIDFNGQMEEYWLDAKINNFNLSHIVKGSFQTDFNGKVFLNGESFKNKTLLLDISLDLDESSFHEYNFHKAFGKVLVTTKSLRFDKSFLFGYFDNEFLVEGDIVYSDSVKLTLTAELPDLKRYEKKLFLEYPAGRGVMTATLTGLTKSPDLKGELRSDSLWLYGLYADSAYATFDINRLFTGQKGVVEASFYRGKAWALPYDSLYFFVSPDSNLLTIDTVEINTAVASIWSNGQLDHGLYPQQLILDTMGIVFFDQVFTNDRAIKIEIDSQGFALMQTTVVKTDGRLSIVGLVGYDESMALELEAENVEIAPWLSLFENSPRLDASLSAQIDLKGSFEAPQFVFEGRLDALTDTDTSKIKIPLLLGDVVAQASYEAGRLIIDTVQLFTPGGIHSASGYLHADLAFVDDDRDRFPDLPMDIHITSHDKRFDLVMRQLPSVDSLAGEFTADITLSGTPNDPHLEGSALIKNTRLLYSDLVDPIFSDSASVTMSDDQIILDHLPIYTLTKDGRSVGSINGVVTVKSLDNLHYNLDADISDITPIRYSLEDIEGEINGKVHIEGDTPPKVTGSILLTSLDYEVPFADEEEGSPVMLALTGEDAWDLDIDLEFPNRFRVKNRDIDAEFSGNLTLVRENGVSRFIGELEVIRGRAFLFDKVFRLDPGSRVSFQGNEIINPNLDIIANTKILGIPQQTNEGRTTREQMDLTVHIGGTMEEPDINPAEGSQFAKEDLIPLLVANYYSAGDVQTESAFGERLTALLSSQVTQRTSVSFGESTFAIEEIDPAYYGELDWSKASITTGFYYSQMYISSRHTPGQGEVFQDLGVEFRFSRAFMLEGHRSDQKEYQLNLKLHLEF